jgi:hypothetical protein
MKYFIILFLMSSTLLSAQSEGPSIEFKEKIKALGNVGEGLKHSYGFRFRNVGREPLVIQQVKVSCGCLSANYPKEPILPSKEGEVVVMYNSVTHKGEFSKSFTVVSNDPDNRYTELVIHGKLVRGKINSPKASEMNK